ncbi:hypothetical protein L2D00_12265 [Hyphomonadaceae bacterium BL14]|nr:hypothetical protein L2D00_12265 [Hyphomonadaceae bacterium BL14]
MARDTDDREAERATRKALARIRRARDAVTRAIAEAGDRDAAESARAELTDWEDEFMASVEARLNEYGSAFADPAKGAPGEALSRLQLVKLKEIEAKARGKPRGGFAPKRASFRSRTPPAKPRSRDIHEDVDAPPADPPRIAPVLSPPGAPDRSGQAPAPSARPVFKVIKGGKDD